MKRSDKKKRYDAANQQTKGQSNKIFTMILGGLGLYIIVVQGVFVDGWCRTFLFGWLRDFIYYEWMFEVIIQAIIGAVILISLGVCGYVICSNEQKWQVRLRVLAGLGIVGLVGMNSFVGRGCIDVTKDMLLAVQGEYVSEIISDYEIVSYNTIKEGKKYQLQLGDGSKLELSRSLKDELEARHGTPITVLYMPHTKIVLDIK